MGGFGARAQAPLTPQRRVMPLPDVQIKSENVRGGKREKKKKTPPDFGPQPLWQTWLLCRDYFILWFSQSRHNTLLSIYVRTSVSGGGRNVTLRLHVAATNGAVSFINTGLMTEPAIMIIRLMSVCAAGAHTGVWIEDIRECIKGMFWDFDGKRVILTFISYYFLILLVIFCCFKHINNYKKHIQVHRISCKRTLLLKISIQKLKY